MDLSKLNTVAAAERGFELELLHPIDGSVTGIYVTVLGRDSAAFRNMQAEQSRKRVAKAQKLGNTRLSLSSKELDDDATELLASCTRSWRTVDLKDKTEKPAVIISGEELPCTVDNAKRVYAEWPWIREQVDAAVVDRANFSPR